MKKYTVSDLVMENSVIERIGDLGSDSRVYSEVKTPTARICRLNVSTESDSKKYGCGVGSYVTVYTRELWRMGVEETEEVAREVAEELRAMISRCCPHKAWGELSVLVVGIGNAKMTPDSIGPHTVDKLTVTRHLRGVAPTVFEKLGRCSVSALNCGVMGDTGMRSVEIIKGVADNTAPDVVLAVDSLCAKSYDRLAATVQLSDRGIVPGAGIGQAMSAVDRETVGVPVIAIGVPTVVSAATLVEESVRKSGYKRIAEGLAEVLERTRDLFVAPKECDLIATRVSDLLARAIDSALCVIKEK